MSVRLLSFLILSLTIPAIGASNENHPHLQVQLLSNLAGRPKSNFKLGVLFKIEKGWHLYWKNPGDSGREPRFHWTLTSGFAIGAIEWPTPQRIPFGPLVNFGYEGTLLLATNIEGPKSWSGKIPVTLALDWLICSVECIPGKTKLEVSLPDSAAIDVFAKTLPLLPIDPAIKVDATTEGDKILLRLPKLPSGKEFYFFPEDRGLLKNASPQSLVELNGVRTLTLIRSDQAPETIQRLGGVLRVDQKGYNIAVDIRNSSREK